MQYISVIALLVIQMMTLAQEPMKIEEKNSAQYRWLNKEVLETHILDNMEDKIQWTSFTGGAIGLADSRIERKSEEAKRNFVNHYSSQIRSHTGEKTILIRFPAKFEVPGPKSGSGWGTAGIRYMVQNEDWTKFNRISVWIYPDNPGAYQNWLDPHCRESL